MKNKFLKPTHPLLRKFSKKISLSNIQSKQTKALIQKMLEIAKGEQGNPKKPIMVGLAAPQIGVPKRVILVDTKANGKGKTGELEVFINPHITWDSPKKVYWYEGCYSLPEICGIVKRAHKVKIEALTLNGDLISKKYTGYIARIFQHEIDHLDGKFFTDLVDDPHGLHRVKPQEFPSYRDQMAWKNWPRKYPLEKLKKIVL